MSDAAGQTDLMLLLDEAAGRLTPQERRLSTHLVEQLERWGYLSSTELAAAVGVHRSTVVRFAQNLGFKGYPELQEAARRAYLKVIAAPTRELVLRDPNAPGGRTLSAVYRRELENLKRSYGHLDLSALEATAEGLAGAQRVLVFGRRFSHPIALHLTQLLSTMREGVAVAPPAGGTAVDQLFDLSPADYVLVVSMRRHSHEVQRTLRFVVDTGVPVTVLTDASPGNTFPASASVLRAHVGGTGVLESYTALISVGHALLTITETLLPGATERLVLAERAWERFNTER